MRPLHSIIIKPAGSFCNIACIYCFYLDKHQLYTGVPSTHRMNQNTLEALIKQMFAYSPTPTFLWQGGEPTVMGLEFFQLAVDLQKYYAHGQPFFNALQTNGLLLNNNWAEFLKKQNFLVGISIDGAQSIHDHYRLDRQGKGTFQQVWEKSQLLLDMGVQVNVLASVTDYSAQYPEEIYEFFVENRLIFMQFSPVVELDVENPQQTAAFSVSAYDYGHFLNRLFKVWMKDFDYQQLKQKTSIRFFDALLQRYIGRTPDHCALQRECNVYLVVEHTGDLYSCDFLVGTDTKVGNLHVEGLLNAFNSAQHIAFGKRKADYGEECERCQWLSICYGGCIKDRLYDPKDHGHNHFCESYQFFFSRADSQFQELAALYNRYYR